MTYDEIIKLSERLFDEAKYRESLLLMIGTHLLLKASDLRVLKFEQILAPTITINDQSVKIPSKLSTHAKSCMKSMEAKTEDYCFTSKKGGCITVQRINVLLKCICADEALTTHSLRKIGALHLYEKAVANGSPSLLVLGQLKELLKQSNVEATRKYLGIAETSSQPLDSLMELM